MGSRVIKLSSPWMSEVNTFLTFRQNKVKKKKFFPFCWGTLLCTLNYPLVVLQQAEGNGVHPKCTKHLLSSSLNVINFVFLRCSRWFFSLQRSLSLEQHGSDLAWPTCLVFNVILSLLFSPHFLSLCSLTHRQKMFCWRFIHHKGRILWREYNLLDCLKCLPIKNRLLIAFERRL